MKLKLPDWYCYAKKRTAMYLLFMMLFLLIPGWGEAQKTVSKTITYKASQVKAEAVLRAIEQQTSSTLTYNREEMNSVEIQEINWKNKPLPEALKELKEEYGILHAMTGDNIALKLGAKPGPAKKTPLPGKIAGKVIDEENGEPVVDATISIGSKGAITAIDGSFSLQLPKGKYEAEISSVGYGKKLITDIDVKENQTYEFNVTLRREKGQLSTVVVKASARKESVAALYVRQKNNAAISDGISQEQIARTPDKNIGESLKRISGLATVDNRYVVVRGLNERYNGAMLNGQLMPSTELNRKQFSFDIIPSNMVDNVVVSKTLTPDKSAGFGGGLVEVNMLDIPTQNFLRVSAGTSINDKTTGKNFLTLPLDGGEYRGKISKHRNVLGRSNWKGTQEIIDAYDAQGKNPGAISNNWGLALMKAPVSQNYQISLGQVIDNGENGKWGIMAAGSYRNTFQRQNIRFGRDNWGPSNSASVIENAYGTNYGFTTNISGMLGIGYQTKRTRISLHSLYLRTYDQQLTIIDSGVHQLGNWGYYDITTQTNMWQTTLKGEYAIGKKGVKINWSGGYTNLNKLRPDNHQAITSALINDDVPNNINVQNMGATGISTGALRWWTRVQEKNFNWDISASVPFLLGSNKQVFKGGYGGWNKDRLFYVLLSGSGGFGNGYYVPLRELYSERYNHFFEFSRQFGDDYKVSLPLHAVYAMLDNRLGNQWRLVWGVRAESYNIGRANQVLDVMEEQFNQDYSSMRNREKNLQFFPSANLTYSLTSKMNLRLAYAKSIIRPDLRELTNFKEYDFELGGSYQGGLVRSTILHHYDFRYEWYPGPGDVISASAFYKKLDYPMSIYVNQGSGSFFLLNDKVAKNYGFEVEARKSFAFTGVPVLRNITLFGNFTYLDSKVRRMNITYEYPDDPRKPVPVEEIYDWEKRPQTGASNYMYNTGFYFDTKPVSVNLVYNVVTNRLFRPDETLVRSLYEQPLNSLDAQLAVRALKQKLEVKLNVSNLLNEFAVVYYNAGPNVADDKPLSKKEARYKAEYDYVNYKNYPGRTYAITLTYSFQ